MPNFIKNVINIRAHYTIKNKIVKYKVMFLLLLDLFFFFKKIIGLIQIFKRVHSYFCRLNYIYIYKGNFQNFRAVFTDQFMLNGVFTAHAKQYFTLGTRPRILEMNPVSFCKVFQNTKISLFYIF